MVIGIMEAGQKMVSKEVFDAVVQSKDAEIVQLKFQLAEYQRMVHGAKTERFKLAVDPQ